MSDELSPEAKAMLEAGRDDGLPSAEDRERVRRRLVATLGVGAFGTLGTASKASAVASIGETGAAGSSGTFASMPAAAKLALAAVGVAGLVGLGVVVRTPPAAPTAPASATTVRTAPPPTPPAAVVARPAPVAPSAPEPAPVVEVPAARTAPPAPPRATGSTVKRAATPTWTPGDPLEMTQAHAPTLQPELALIGAAQAALGSGDAAAALAHLDRHAEHFAHGVLAQERMAARAIALCRLERLVEGRAELARLDREAPRSPLLTRARGECER